MFLLKNKDKKEIQKINLCLRNYFPNNTPASPSWELLLCSKNLHTKRYLKQNLKIR